jgi:hypothetical protein
VEYHRKEESVRILISPGIWHLFLQYSTSERKVPPLLPARPHEEKRAGLGGYITLQLPRTSKNTFKFKYVVVFSHRKNITENEICFEINY